MKTCDKCKHWFCPTGDEDYFEHKNLLTPQDIDTGTGMKFYFGVGICRHPKLGFCERPVEENGFSVADGSDYMANLITAEKFGCIKHEDKE